MSNRKSIEAFKQASKDIRQELNKQGKQYISCSVKAINTFLLMEESLMDSVYFNYTGW